MRRAIPLAFLLAWPSSLAAQGVEVRLEPSQPIAGEPFAYIVALEVAEPAASSARLKPPDFGALQVLQAPPPEKPRALPSQPGHARLEWRFLLRAVETGIFTIPLPEVTFRDPVAGQVRVLKGRALSFAVLERWQRAAREPDIRDIKETWPSPPRPAWLWLLPLLPLIALALWLRRRRPQKEASPLPLPSEPPHLWALRELEALGRSDRLARGEIDAFIVRLTEILKEYLERRWGLPASRFTTTEILTALHWGEAPVGWVRQVQAILDNCDLEKFAGYPFPAEVARLLLERTVAFVRTTAPATEPPGEGPA